MLEIHASYYDGRHAAEREVVVRLNVADLVARERSGAVVARWPYAALYSADFRPAEDGPFRFGAEGFGTARMVVAQPDDYRELLRRAPNAARPRKAKFSRPLRRRAAISGGIIATVLLAYLAAPWLAQPLSHLVTPAWEQRQGETMATLLGNIFGRCEDPAAEAALARLADRLAAGLELPYPIEVGILDSSAVNAVALPGGRVFFFDGLIQEAQSASEVAGVLAHEIGHVQHRHGVINLLRRSIRGIFVSLLTSGSDRVFNSIVEQSDALLALRNSREMEREADVSAIELLEAAGITGAGFKTFFDRLAGSRDEPGGVMVYLSSHPPSAERAELDFNLEGEQGLTPADWQDVRAACGS